MSSIKGWKMSSQGRENIRKGKMGHKPTNTKGNKDFVWYNNGKEEVFVRFGTILEGEWERGRIYDLESARQSCLVSPKRFNLGLYNKKRFGKE